MSEPQNCHGIWKSVLSTEDLWRVYGAENGWFDVDWTLLWPFSLPHSIMQHNTTNKNEWHWRSHYKNHFSLFARVQAIVESEEEQQEEVTIFSLHLLFPSFISSYNRVCPALSLQACIQCHVLGRTFSICKFSLLFLALHLLDHLDQLTIKAVKPSFLIQKDDFANTKKRNLTGQLSKTADKRVLLFPRNCI